MTILGGADSHLPQLLFQVSTANVVVSAVQYDISCICIAFEIHKQWYLGDSFHVDSEGHVTVTIYSVVRLTVSLFNVSVNYKCVRLNRII